MTKKFSAKTIALGTLGATGTGLGLAALLKPQTQMEIQPEMDVDQIPQPATASIQGQVEDNTFLLSSTREDIKASNFRISGLTGNYNILRADLTAIKVELGRVKEELKKAQAIIEKLQAKVK